MRVLGTLDDSRSNGCTGCAGSTLRTCAAPRFALLVLLWLYVTRVTVRVLIPWEC